MALFTVLLFVIAGLNNLNAMLGDTLCLKEQHLTLNYFITFQQGQADCQISCHDAADKALNRNRQGHLTLCQGTEAASIVVQDVDSASSHAQQTNCSCSIGISLMVEKLVPARRTVSPTAWSPESLVGVTLLSVRRVNNQANAVECRLSVASLHQFCVDHLDDNSGLPFISEV